MLRRHDRVGQHVGRQPLRQHGHRDARGARRRRYHQGGHLVGSQTDRGAAEEHEIGPPCGRDAQPTVTVHVGVCTERFVGTEPVVGIPAGQCLHG